MKGRPVFTAFVSAALICFASSTLSAQSGSNQSLSRPAEPTSPHPLDLASDWWSYFTIEGQVYDERVQETLHIVESAADALPKRLQFKANALISHFATSLSALPRARNAQPQRIGLVPTVKVSYTLRSLSELISRIEYTEEKLKEAQLLIETIRNDTRLLETQISKLVALYQDLEFSTPEKLLLGLQIMAQRAAIALNTQEYRLAKAQRNMLERNHQELLRLMELASQRVDLNTLSQPAIAHLLSHTNARLERHTALLEQEEILARQEVEQTKLPVASKGLEKQRLLHLMAQREITQMQLLYYEALYELVILSQSQDEYDSTRLAEQRMAWQSQLQHSERLLESWNESTEKDLLAATLFRTSANGDPNEAQLQRERELAAERTLATLQQAQSLQHGIAIVMGLMQREIETKSSWIEKVWLKITHFVHAIWPTIHRWMTFPLFHIGEVPFTLWTILRIALIFLVATWVSWAVRAYLNQYSKRKYKKIMPRLYTGGRLWHYFVLFIATIVALLTLGIESNRLLIILGALSVGIGFGLQGVVLNFISGMLILFEGNLRVGDYIELGPSATDSEQVGRITAIHVQNSVIRTFDGTSVIIPNAQLISNRLINWTMQDPYRRLHISFSVAYGSDKEKVRKVVLEAANALPSTVQNHPRYPNADVRLVDFGDSSLNFELLVWVSLDSFIAYNKLLCIYRWEVESALCAHDITIPFPQRDIHIKE